MVKKMKNDIIEKMVLEGVLEISGIDSNTGEFLYSFTNKLKDIYPQLHTEMQNSVSRDMMFLWENNFVTMDVTENNPVVTLTEKAFIKEEIEKLDIYYTHCLNELKRITFLQ